MEAKVENMIDLRIKCLELALKYNEMNSGQCSLHCIQDMALSFERYILEDSKLPETPFNMDKMLYETMLKIYVENDKSEEIYENFDERLRELAKSNNFAK